MPDSQPPNFADRDLRNRSFQGQDLRGANFAGADIRGCNFRRSQLVGANFEGARAGWSRRQMLVPIIAAVLTVLIVADAVSRLIFAALGQTPAEPAWSLVLTLYAMLGATATAAGVMTVFKLPLIAQAIARSVAGGGAGAVVGFCYGGLLAGKKPQVAIATAVVLGLLSAAASLRVEAGLGAVILTATGISTSEGFTFLVGTTAIAFLSTHHIAGGIPFSILALTFLWLTYRNLIRLGGQIQQASSTTFRYAEITDANFAGARLGKSDFGGRSW